MGLFDFLFNHPSEAKRLEASQRALLKALQAQQQEIIELAHQLLQDEPLHRLKDKIGSTLSFMLGRREEIENRWNLWYENASWWEKMNADQADTQEIDQLIDTLKEMKSRFDRHYGKEYERLCFAQKEKKRLALMRIGTAYEHSLKVLQHKSAAENIDSDQLLRYAAWGGIFGMSASATVDLFQAHGLYEALRGVNGNFSSMSDAEIWWETLWMSPESLAGLASLAKGAYFEQLVAENTGGELFEHFNHPDTDIVIDGVEFQLKATDSIAYIESVDANIPVMATTEVAEMTDAIDSGIRNVDLTQTTELALGGTVIDAGDSTVDGLISGLGTLGVFSSLRGFNHTMAHYQAGKALPDAAEEGIIMAVEGTAKGLVDTAEFSYKVVTSAPVKGVGRFLWKVTAGTYRIVDSAIKK